MSKLEIFTTNPISLNSQSFYPRNYTPNFIFVKEGIASCPTMIEYVNEKIVGGSTPPAYFFYKDRGIPFIKTSAVSRHFININDLQLIDESYHRQTIKRSITHPYDVIFTMTGKFMGKAAMCPPTIAEMNMSQNSVLLKTKSALESAFLTIFLNSQINRIQVKGTYSITKQKFLNQGKIANLKVMKYEKRYDEIMKKYVKSFDNYYYSLQKIKAIIDEFNYNFGLSFKDISQYGFPVAPGALDKRMLVPNFYRPDVEKTIDALVKDADNAKLVSNRIKKGDEVGSANYSEDGIPFIKTSDIINFDIDYEPDCYCSESFIKQLKQDIEYGDIIFAKDGKPGEVAIIMENKNVILSSGLVKYRPCNEEERYWLFLLLSSKFGSSYFKKWFVISSTMLHLRKDFFNSFSVPLITEDIKTKYIYRLKQLFELKKESFKQIFKIKDLVEESFTNPNVKLDI